MRKIQITFLLGIFFTCAVYAQHPVKSFIAEYRHKPSNEKFVLKLGKIPIVFASLFLDGETKQLIKKLNKIQMISVEGLKDENAGDVLVKLSTKLKRKNYEELMQVRDGGSLVNVMAISPDDDKIKEIVALINDGGQDVTVIRLKGRFKISEIDGLIKKFNNNDNHSTSFSIN